MPLRFNKDTDPAVVSGVTAVVEATAVNVSDISKIQFWMSQVDTTLGGLGVKIDHVFFRAVVVTGLETIVLSFLTTVLTVKWLLPSLLTP